MAEDVFLQSLLEERDPVLLAAVAEYGYTQDVDELKGEGDIMLSWLAAGALE